MPVISVMCVWCFFVVGKGGYVVGSVLCDGDSGDISGCVAGVDEMGGVLWLFVGGAGDFGDVGEGGRGSCGWRRPVSDVCGGGGCTGGAGTVTG